MDQIAFRSDTWVYLSGPVREADGTAVSESPVSCTARIYDERKEQRTEALTTRLAVDYGAGTTIVIPKPSQSVIAVGDTFRLYALDGSVYDRAITAISEETEGYTLSFSGAISATATAGSAVRIITQATGTTWLTFDRSPKIVVGDSVRIEETTASSATQVLELSFTHLSEPVVNHPRFWAVQVSATSIDIEDNTQCRVQLGADISMSSFGTFPTANPIAGDSDWGFRGLITDTHLVSAGQDVSIEIDYDGGSGQALVTAMRAKVVAQLT